MFACNFMAYVSLFIIVICSTEDLTQDLAHAREMFYNQAITELPEILNFGTGSS